MKSGGEMLRCPEEIKEQGGSEAMGYGGKCFCYKADNPTERIILIKQESQNEMGEKKS